MTPIWNLVSRSKYIVSKLSFRIWAKKQAILYLFCRVDFLISSIWQIWNFSGVGEKICEPCDDCYNLVSDSVNEHRKNLEDLDKLLEQIAENPQPVGGDFIYELRELSIKVQFTLAEAQISSENDNGGTLRDRLEDLREKLKDVIASVGSSNTQIEEAKKKSYTAKEDVEDAKKVIDKARDSLKVSFCKLKLRPPLIVFSIFFLSKNQF